MLVWESECCRKLYGMCGRSVSTGRKCGLDASFRLSGNAVMSSMLPLRGDMFSFPGDPGLDFVSICCASAGFSCGGARRLRSLFRLLERRGTGGVERPVTVVKTPGGGGGCDFSDAGCGVAPFIVISRRFLLNGQIGIVERQMSR